eukprot:TRINITY_DN12802_c0_g1_i1.p1 TRINITY_DN12802_c0_g1~~TRINITY_DN12802_c0_g1_i1.p1  ORF type:complete len:110 (+),score=13.22 TRINITY_DN12802_c0_g1_i1:201-530(+)
MAEDSYTKQAITSIFSYLNENPKVAVAFAVGLIVFAIGFLIYIIRDVYYSPASLILSYYRSSRDREYTKFHLATLTIMTTTTAITTPRSKMLEMRRRRLTKVVKEEFPF